MKKIFGIVLILLLCSTAFGGEQLALVSPASPASPGVGVSAAPPSAYQQTETFDGSSSCYSGGASNCDNVNYFDTINGDPDFTNTTPAMQGTNNLSVDSTDHAHWHFQTAQTTNYFTFRFEATESPASSNTFILAYDSVGGALFYCSIRGDTNDQVFCYLDGDLFDTPDAYVDNAIVADTDYWIKFKHVSGASCSLEVWVSTDGTTWSGSSSVSTTCSNTNQLEQIRLANADSAPSQLYNYDIIKANNSDITDATDDL